MAAVVAGAVMIVSGVQSHPPEAAPLPNRPFDVRPEDLPPLGLPPLREPVITDERPDCPIRVTPGHLVVGSLCINAKVVPTSATASGALNVPADVHIVGQWTDGAPVVGPDAQPLATGTTLLAGHVNDYSQGNGELHDLYKVAPGALVYVSDAAGHITRWRVTAQTAVVKAALPQWLFAGAQGPRQLALVTCGGPVISVPGYGNTYRDNVIVTAVPV